MDSSFVQYFNYFRHIIFTIIFKKSVNAGRSGCRVRFALTRVRYNNIRAINVGKNLCHEFGAIGQIRHVIGNAVF